MIQIQTRAMLIILPTRLRLISSSATPLIRTRRRQCLALRHALLACELRG